MFFRHCLSILFFCLYANCVNAKGELTDNIKIDSKVLNYKLQYRVYVPDNVDTSTPLPTIFITDGQWYIQKSGIIDTLNALIKNKKIRPVIAVFIDSRNPEQLSINRRNDEFQCNKDYVLFYLKELIPEIERNYAVSKQPKDRVIAGLSFGGLNAACFGLMASDHFSGIAMQSPANSEHLKLLNSLYGKTEKLALNIFFSIGTKNDNTKAARKFHRTLLKKKYKINYIEVPFGHNWKNWRPLVDNLLLTFFAEPPQG